MSKQLYIKAAYTLIAQYDQDPRVLLYLATNKATHLRPARLQGSITRPVQDVSARLILRADHMLSISIPLTIPRGIKTCMCQRSLIAWRSLMSEGTSAEVKHRRDRGLSISWVLKRFSPVQVRQRAVCLHESALEAAQILMLTPP